MVRVAGLGYGVGFGKGVREGCGLNGDGFGMRSAWIMEDVKGNW